MLRRILRALVRKKRDSAAQADLPAWNLNDLLFISALGEYEHRGVSFAHFRDSGNGQPQLRTFSWDQRETHFCYLRNLNLENLRWPQDDGDAETWREQWSSAFTTKHGWQLGASKDLSLELAQLARRTRALVREVYNYELKTGPLHHLYESFRTVLVHDLDLDGFADMVAQTIAYGLFSARATGEAVLGLSHLEAMVPNTNPFLRELLAEFTRISGYRRHQIDFDELGVSELVELLNETDMESVLRDFGRQTGGGVEDPVIHFYELFLNEYDKQQKVQRGVFYTPKPVVSFIVHSVHELLRTEFGLEDGLADTTTWGEMINRNKALKLPEGASPDEPFVQILDPATGTGTFLETVIDVIYETMTTKWSRERKSNSQVREAWNEYVPKHLLPRLHGFELMMAPYAVAHMKLALKLRQTGYDFKAGERLRVYLTNTLASSHEDKGQLELIPEFLSYEAKAADEVKQNTPITVMIGNPPYFGHSANENDWIRNLLRTKLKDGADSYFSVDGKDIGERNPKWLNDDYVKFIRYGQYQAAHNGEGILAYITNHGYLNNPTFRGMRQSLRATFSQISVLDLHGNVKKKEQSPDGSSDDNVFDIQQGVGIIIAMKRSSQISDDVFDTSVVRHADLWGYVMKNTTSYTKQT
ncbi:MAG: N-6 DNA methylase [Planctomycetota bacterium]